jgi:hypothetical protein
MSKFLDFWTFSRKFVALLDARYEVDLLPLSAITIIDSSPVSVASSSSCNIHVRTPLKRHASIKLSKTKLSKMY